MDCFVKCHGRYTNFKGQGTIVLGHLTVTCYPYDCVMTATAPPVDTLEFVVSNSISPKSLFQGEFYGLRIGCHDA